METTIIQSLCDKYGNCEEQLTIDYYPHIVVDYATGGHLMNETITEYEKIFDNDGKYTKNVYDYTEYVHNNKKMLVHANNDKEYIEISQLECIVSKGLYNLHNFIHIDPNKFPILNKYYDVCNYHELVYKNKYLNVHLISDLTNSISFIKISFSLPKYDTYQTDDKLKKIIKLIQNMNV